MKTILIILFLTLFYCMDAQMVSTPIKYLALGDSYTIGESVSEPERWPNQLVDSMAKKGIQIGKPTIIATTGWCTDDLRNAMNNAHLKNEYELVSLLIGVNNQYQGKSSSIYASEFEELLKWAVQLARGKKQRVFVVSIPDYGFTPFGKPKQGEISKAIDEFNEINAQITYKYGIRYFNITDISRDGLSDPSWIATDGLHPSGKMYAHWVELISKGLDIH
ncbi:MAG: SGNH/GDSL hydrolase family protein [Cyclobacteriaceae bacterium]|nr:SGNH/GDSL hydrolase family protein [Cyclobacteriaceae bacterium]